MKSVIKTIKKIFDKQTSAPTILFVMTIGISYTSLTQQIDVINVPNFSYERIYEKLKTPKNVVCFLASKGLRRTAFLASGFLAWEATKRGNNQAAIVLGIAGLLSLSLGDLYIKFHDTVYGHPNLYSPLPGSRNWSSLSSSYPIEIDQKELNTLYKVISTNSSLNNANNKYNSWLSQVESNVLKNFYIHAYCPIAFKFFYWLFFRKRDSCMNIPSDIICIHKYKQDEKAAQKFIDMCKNIYTLNVGFKFGRSYCAFMEEYPYYFRDSSFAQQLQQQPYVEKYIKQKITKQEQKIDDITAKLMKHITREILSKDLLDLYKDELRSMQERLDKLNETLTNPAQYAMQIKMKDKKINYENDCLAFRKYVAGFDKTNWLNKLPVEVWCHICTFLTPSDSLKQEIMLKMPNNLEEKKQIRKITHEKRQALMYCIQTGKTSIRSDRLMQLLSYCYFKKSSRYGWTWEPIILNPADVQHPIKLSKNLKKIIESWCKIESKSRETKK